MVGINHSMKFHMKFFFQKYTASSGNRTRAAHVAGEHSFTPKIYIPMKQKHTASSGNRTRAARVAGEHSTTEPTMLAHQSSVLPPPN